MDTAQGMRRRLAVGGVVAAVTVALATGVTAYAADDSGPDGALGSLTGLVGGPAALQPGCSRELTGPTVTCRYGPGTYEFTVPDGVSTLGVVALGAAGGGGRGPAGAGARLTATLEGLDQNVLTVVAGAVGRSSSNGPNAGGAGYGDGGAAPFAPEAGGGGGGGSAVLEGGEPLLVAGGGGGSGTSDTAGGASGQDGSGRRPGQAGGSDDENGTGGGGGFASGGGGGGGARGGSGGGGGETRVPGSGGGGGTSAGGTEVEDGVNNGPGEVTLTYTEPDAGEPTSPVTPTSAPSCDEDEKDGHEKDGHEKDGHEKDGHEDGRSEPCRK